MPPVASPATSAPAPETAPAATPGEFRRLPRSAATFRMRRYGTINLYLTETYLLQIEVISFREIYQKFAYKDIQAIELARTERGAVYNWILGVFAAVIACFIPVAGSVAAMGVLGGFAGFFAVLLVINLGRGTTCRCTVQTATGRQVLRSLGRMRPARRALALITGRIDAAQGELDQNAGARQMEDFLLRRADQQRQRGQGGAQQPVNIIPAPAPAVPDAY